MKSFLNLQGEWNFKSDVEHDPYKTGWIYESKEIIHKNIKQGK